MDPASAFALACNVVQAALWCYETGQAVYQIYKDGTTPANEHLDGLTQKLKLALGGLRNLQNIASPTDDDKQLKEIADTCYGIADDLHKKLTDLKMKSAGGRREKLQAAVRTLWGREGIKSLEKDLEDIQRLLHTAGLVHNVNSR